MNEHEVRSFLARAGEQLGAGGDAGHDRPHLVATGDLQAVRAVVGVVIRAQQLVQMSSDISD
jgi:hypothetical protein